MKIQLFEHGTLFIHQNNHCHLELSANKVLAERSEDLLDLLGESPYFFPLLDVTNTNGRFVLEFKIVEGYRPLVDAKKYSSVLRLSLLNKLLELDPLHNFKERVMIHPRNIFFKDMKTLKFLYRSNQWLPYEDHLDKLEQYKILILSMFSRFSYEKYKREKGSLLKKETDEFLFHIENARSVQALKKLIAIKLQNEESQHFFRWENEKQKVRKQKMMWMGTSIGICAIGIVLALFLQQSAVNKVQTAYATELKKAEDESTFYKLLSREKYDEALALLKQGKGSKKEKAELYFKTGQYQKAIDTDKAFIKPTVETLYKLNKKEEIMGLKADSNYLEIEKRIVSYDYSVLLSKQAFSKDKDQQIRIGMAFAEHGDLEDAKILNKSLNNKELAAIIQKKELEKQVASINQQIQEIQESDVPTEEKQAQLKPKNREITNLKTQLKEVNNELEVE
ncbi:type VII secretion protein EssB/YukC [Neobacillus mesonae]|uniref:type VII secretion protein EssB/YukC n=1 Tax=Neobacillus mesonae TaxID=1193713 RepID=UPI00203D626D|nr:type VII secretion protein EssB/YukC [Neobacillus mesonae]MCM3570615.1 hypothetical protein [Neobacillus mesonae]